MKSFFLYKTRFNKSYSGPLGDIDGFFQLLPGAYRCDKSTNIAGDDKVNLKIICINGSIVIGIREPILYRFCFISPLGHKIDYQPRIKLKKKPVLSHITYYLEDDDHKPVKFSGEMKSFTCQLIEI